MSKAPNIVGFQAYKTDSGEQRYGVRGIGPDYTEFWTWAHNRITITEDDWPWTYFRFIALEDEQIFWRKYNQPGNRIDTEFN